jgi:hypothetical protein
VFEHRDRIEGDMDRAIEDTEVGLPEMRRQPFSCDQELGMDEILRSCCHVGPSCHTSRQRTPPIRLPRQVMLPASGYFINPVMVGNRCSSGDYRAGFSCRTDGTPKLRSDKFATIDDTLSLRFTNSGTQEGQRRLRRTDHHRRRGDDIGPGGASTGYCQPTRPCDPRRAPCEPRHPCAFRHLAPASSPLPAAMKTPMTWTGYGWRLRDFFAVFAD